MSKQQRASATKTGGESAKTDVLSNIIEQFESLSTAKALGVCVALALAMVAYIYRDFLFGNAVLLYTDIGSDAVNIFYPVWYQQAKLWAEHGVTSGYSLETVMGSGLSISTWDPFTFLIIKDGPAGVASNVAIVEVLKSLLIALFAFPTFRMTGFRNTTSLIGALCFAFSGYVALGASGWYVHSTEVLFIVAALWATEFALSKHWFGFVFVPLIIYYLANASGYMVIYISAALLFYIPLRALTMDEQFPRLRRGAIAFGALVCGLLISASTITGMFSGLMQSGRAEALKVTKGGSLSREEKTLSITKLADRGELTKVVQRAYSTNALGVGNNYRGTNDEADNFLEGPLLYMGLPMLLFLPLYGVGRNRRDKIAWGAMLGAVLMMLLFPWFRAAFWGFNLNYFREFTMLIGAFLLVLSMRGLDGMISSPAKGHRLWVPVAALAMVVLPFIAAKPANIIDASQRTTSVVLLMGMGGAAVAYVMTRRSAMLLALLALTIVDLSLNASSTITDRSVLTKTDIRNGRLYGDASLQAVDWIKSSDKDLFRIVKYNTSGPAIHPSLNDAMVQGFNGLIGYSSFHNKYYMRFMTELECVDLSRPEESKWVSRIITRPFLASALGAKYFIAKGAPFGFLPELFPQVQTLQDQFVHRSSVALPLLVAYESTVTPDAFRQLNASRKDYMLFRAVVLEPDAATKFGIASYNMASDSVKNVTPLNFVQAADERKALMSVTAATTIKGISATVNLQRPAVVVTTIPYDEGIRVIIDGKPAETTIANFGFVGVRMDAGKHNVEVSYGS